MDLDFLHASCAVMICVSRAYPGAFWNCGDLCAADGSVLDTLRDCAVVGLGDGPTLRDGAVVGVGDAPLGGNVVGALVGRDVASIPCRFLMAYIYSSPTKNGDSGSGLFSASTRSFNAWCAASVDECFGTGKLCGEKFTVLTILSAFVAGK